MLIPTKLAFESLDVSWVNIEAPADTMNQLSLWMIQCHPLSRCGGSAGPWFINMAFSKENAQRIITKLTEMVADGM